MFDTSCRDWFEHQKKAEWEVKQPGIVLVAVGHKQAVAAELWAGFWRSHPRNAEGEGDSRERFPEPSSTRREQQMESVSGVRALLLLLLLEDRQGKGWGEERGKRRVKDGLHWREGGRMKKDLGRGVWVQLSWLHSGEQTVPEKKKKGRIWFKFAHGQRGQLSAFTPKSTQIWSLKYPMNKANKSWSLFFFIPI